MTVITKSTTTGLDTKIQSLQSILHTNLISTWNILAEQYDCYGRIYRVPTKDGFQFEAYNSNNEYTGNIFQRDTQVEVDEVLYPIAAMSFFNVVENRTVNTFHAFMAITELVYFVDLKILKSSITHRADEEIVYDVFNLLKREPLGFKLINLITGVENVFAGIDLSKIKYDDMQPYFIFKFIMNINHR